MPQYDITSPDGRKFRINAPDGATKEQALSFAQSQFAEKQPDALSTALNRSGTAAVVDAGLSLASGAVAAPVAGLAGLGVTALKGPDAGAEAVRKLQGAMTYAPRTDTGAGIVKAAAYPFQKLADVSDAAGAKVTDVTGSPAAGAGVNTAFQAVPLVLGRIGPAGEAEAAATNALRLKNAPADAAATAAREAKLAVPPSQANPSMWNKIMEGFAGKIKTAQDLSLKNQPIGNDLVRKGLGLAEDAPLTPQTLSAKRREAGQAYERVRDAGRVTADPAYFQVLDQVAAPFERAAKDFPDAARTDILDAVKAARRDSFDAGSAVDQISILRDKADTAYRASDKKLGKAYKDIAGALEEQLGRHLEQLSTSNEYSTAKFSPQDLEAFRNARQTIAQTYTVEKHLQPNGDVDMRGLAADLKRGKPLSGEIKQAAEFATNFPKAAQLPEKVGGVPMSPLDHGFSLATLAASIATGHPMAALAALAPYARPVLRKAIGSEAYQNTFASPREYGPGTLEKLRELQARPGLQALEMSEAQRQ